MPDSSTKRTATQKMARLGRKRAKIAQRKKNREEWAETRAVRQKEHAELKAEILATKEINEARALLNQVEQLADRVDTYFKLGISRMAEEFGPLLEEEIKAAHEGDARARRFVLENMVKWKPGKEVSHSLEQDAMAAMMQAATDGNVAEMTLKVSPHESTDESVGESVEGTYREVAPGSM